MNTKPESKNSEFVEIASENLDWHLSRLKFFETFVCALLKVQTVCFSRLAEGFESTAKLESRHRRIQRFFADFVFDPDMIAGFIFMLLPCKGPYQLCIDRTNWKFGKLNINILMLSVAYKGIGIPLLWTMLPKQGNSNEAERRRLIRRYLNLFGPDSIECIMGDREFIGQKWFRYLANKGIPFYMRVKENMWITLQHGCEFKAYKLFRHLKFNCAKSFGPQVSIDGNKVYLHGMKILNKEGKREFVIIATLTPDPDALTQYKERWQIETMFKGLKSSGFNIEDTHLKDLNRLSKLLALLSVAYVWAYRVGIYCNDYIKPIQIKKHGRRAISYFKYGLKFIAQALLNPTGIKDYEICTKVLSCT
jgi:hypothetical protein